MEDKFKNKVKKFVSKRTVSGVETEEEMLTSRDGLFERRELINKTYVTRSGKQLLREENYR